MKRNTKITLAVVTVLGLGAAALPVIADDDWECGRWGKSTMFKGGHHGMGFMGMRSDKPMTAERLKEIAEGLIAWRGNENLKVGEIKEKDEKTFSVVIVTKEGSLVDTIDVDKATGRPAGFMGKRYYR